MSRWPDNFTNESMTSKSCAFTTIKIIVDRKITSQNREFDTSNGWETSTDIDLLCEAKIKRTTSMSLEVAVSSGGRRAAKMSGSFF